MISLPELEKRFLKLIGFINYYKIQLTASFIIGKDNNYYKWERFIYAGTKIKAHS